jgi:hypothetical protein
MQAPRGSRESVDGTSTSGVIDWGDLCVGDPADLQLVWSLLPAAQRQSFFAEYGPVERETGLRAQVPAVYLCTMLRSTPARSGTRHSNANRPPDSSGR